MICECQLQIAECFTFTLPASKKSDTEIIREELSALKAEKLQLMREHKLFQHYFVNYYFNESGQASGKKMKQYLLDSIIESPSNLYNICEGMAFEADAHY